MQIFSVTISLPAGLDDERAGSLLYAPGEYVAGCEILSSSAGREGRNYKSDWRLQWFFENVPPEDEFIRILDEARAQIAPELTPITRIAVEEVPDVNWLQHTYESFPPFREGAFFIYGSHYDGTLPHDAIPLKIDAATAFGSGEHGTTAGCLHILQTLKHDGFNPANILDLGTGSGILGVGAWKLWEKSRVLGTDIDPEAVRVADEHRDLNTVPAGAEDGMINIVSDGFDQGELKGRAPYDLTIANILAGPLKMMASDIAGVTRKDGYIILSGMLNEQADEVLAIYEENGAACVTREIRGDWTSLLLKKI